VELAGGIAVYPARFEGDRWRAVWYEDGRRRQCQDLTEAGLAARLEKVTVRLAADAPGLEAPSTDLIAYYLPPDRHPAGRAWSRKHADTQRRLCQRYLAPVIDSVRCEDIKVSHMQAAVNSAPTAGEGDSPRCTGSPVSARCPSCLADRWGTPLFVDPPSSRPIRTWRGWAGLWRPRAATMN
jgi:hypothetical protein